MKEHTNSTPESRNPKFKKWANKELGPILKSLGFTNSQILDVVHTATNLGSESEIREYFTGLAGDTPDATKFVQEYLHRRRSTPTSKKEDSQVANTTVQYQPLPQQTQMQPTVDSKHTVDLNLFGTLMKVEKKNKGKKKVTNLANLQFDSMVLPGRIKCDCEGKKHNVITNCIECGRIVCEQEGLGKCMHCGAVVKDPNAAQTQAMPRELVNAIQHKDKLINYDRTAAKRTAVIDDQEDYYESTSNRWLTEEEKGKAKEKEKKREQEKEESHKLKFTFDFAGRRILVDSEAEELKYAKIFNKSEKEKDETQDKEKSKKAVVSTTKIESHPSVRAHKPHFVSENPSLQPKSQSKKKLAKSLSKFEATPKVQHSFYEVEDLNLDEDVYVQSYIKEAKYTDYGTHINHKPK